jgi:hypothetical protein
MSIKYSNISNSKALQNIPKLFLVCKLPSGNPVWGNDKKLKKWRGKRRKSMYMHTVHMHMHTVHMHTPSNSR